MNKTSKLYMIKIFLFLFIATLVFVQNNVVLAFQITDEEIQEVREILIELEVEDDKIPVLLDKLKKGQAWDNINPKYKNLKPQIVNKNYSKTIYPDGSVMIEGIIEDSTDYEQIENSGLLKKDKIRLQLNQKLKVMGVEENTRKDLINKFLKGETWDSFNPKYADLKPQIVKDGYSKTIYPDGSVMIEGTIDDLSDSKQIMASGLDPKDKVQVGLRQILIEEGISEEEIPKLIDKLMDGERIEGLDIDYSEISDYLPLGNYGQVKRSSAYREGGLVALYFEVTYRQSSETNEAQILYTDNRSYRGLGANISEIQGRDGFGHLYGWRNPTHAWYAVDVKSLDNNVSRRYWLKFFVNGSETWTTDNFYL